MKVHLYFSCCLLAVLYLFANKLHAQPITFDEHPIDANYQGMSCVVVYDLDKDGDKDIIGGSEWTPYSQSIGVAWWRNNGGDPISWSRFYVDVSFNHVMSVDVAYVDNDTFPDIVATSWDLHQVAWWKNSGNPVYGWSKGIVKSAFQNAHDAECIDVNQDGFTDVVGICSTPGVVIVCYNDGSDPPNWNTQTLSGSFAGGKSVSTCDFDRDGDPDIIGTAADANRIAWWENRGGNPVTWLYRPITSSLSGSHDIDIVDMNGDSLYDVIATGWLGDEVSYWICNDLATNNWSKTMVTNQLDVAVKALGRDFDSDGDVDIVAVGKSPGQLQLYENVDSSWTPINLKQDFEGGWALASEDLDGDGDMDIIAGASALGVLSWWENDSNIVPVQVTSFFAETSTAGVMLTWKIVHDESINGIRIYKRWEGDPVFAPVATGALMPVRTNTYTDGDVLPGRTYQYYLAVAEEDGSETRSRVITVRTGMGLLSLYQNCPNPFNPSTIISFALPQKVQANLSIYDVRGKLVATLLNQTMREGFHEASWDGTDVRGVPVRSGIYFCRLVAGKKMLTRKMVLLE